MYSHAYASQLKPNLPPFDLNLSVVKLLQHHMELTHGTQHLQQQMTNALQNIARSSAFQENQHFINDIPFFKAKDPQSLMIDWSKSIK